MSVSEQEGVLVAADGRRVGWMTRGVPEGRTVGWLHGQPGSRRDTRAMTDELLERHGLRLLSIDRAGYGETTPVGLDRRDVAQDLFAAADHVGVHELPLVAASAREDAAAGVRHLAETMSPREQQLARGEWGELVAASAAFGLQSHEGYLEDGLRTLRPLEVDLTSVRCPVRAVHGEADDLEPYANLRRLAPLLEDFQAVALPGLGHFGPWLWPDVVLGLLSGA